MLISWSLEILKIICLQNTFEIILDVSVTRCLKKIKKYIANAIKGNSPFSIYVL